MRYAPIAGLLLAAIGCTRPSPSDPAKPFPTSPPPARSAPPQPPPVTAAASVGSSATPDDAGLPPVADAALSPAEEYAARVKAGRVAAELAGDVVRVDSDTWTLQSFVTAGAPAFRFQVRGAIGEGDNDDEVIVTAGASSLNGPASVAVFQGARLIQRLQRRAPNPDPLDMNTFVGVDPLRLDRLPMRERSSVHAGDIELADVNFDGAMDLHVTVGMAHKCPIVQHYLYQPATNSFVENRPLGQLNCLSWIADRKLVVSSEWTCCEDRIAVYHWEGPRLVLEREIWRERGDGGKAKITYHEMRNGKPVTRVEETVSEKAEP